MSGTVILKYFAVVFFVLSCITSSYAQKKWRLKRDKEGIQVHTRKVDISALDEYRATATIRGDMNHALHALQDSSLIPLVFADLKEAKVWNISPNSFDVFVQTNAPFPVRDRVSCYRNKIERHQDSILVRINCLDDCEFAKERSSNVQIKNCSGYWKFEQIDSTSFQATHQMLANPGGNLPRWIVNSKTAKSPFLTMKNLRWLIEAKRKSQ